MGLAASGTVVELREVLLRDKPSAMIEASPKGTVPVLVLPDGEVIDESLDIMLWALDKQDNEALLEVEREAQLALVQSMDQAFKPLLDRYKYPSRYQDEPTADHRELGMAWIKDNLGKRLEIGVHLFGDTPMFADIAIFPFMRQFAHVDRDWFYATAPEGVGGWLKGHIESARFAEIMDKHKQWEAGTRGVSFPKG